MKKTIIICVLVVLGVGIVNVHSATYTWDGSAGDGKWLTATNWTVSNSKYTWPNEQKIAHISTMIAIRLLSTTVIQSIAVFTSVLTALWMVPLLPR